MATEPPIGAESAAVALNAQLGPRWARRPNAAHTDAAATAIFEVVVAAIWSRGALMAAEVERGRAVATALGVRARGGGAFSTIAAGALAFAALGFECLDGPTATLAYALAAWSTTPGEASPRRTQFLRALATRLEVGAPAIRRVELAIAGVDATRAAPLTACSLLITELGSQPS